MLCHFIIKIIHCAIEAACRKKAVVYNIFHFYLLTGFAGKYHYFAHNVCAAKVQARVRLGVAFILRLFLQCLQMVLCRHNY